MSTYSRTNAAGKTLWRYDFQWGGGRHVSAEPHYATKAKAEAAERAARKALMRGGSLTGSSKASSRKAPPRLSAVPAIDAAPVVTLEAAADRYWRDVGQSHRSASDIKRRIEICKRLLGPETSITEIRTSTVIDAVQARMKEQTLTRYGKPSGRLVSGPGANRDVVDQLRPILNHAVVAFEDDDLALKPIQWKRARQAEADPASCEFSDDEVTAWVRELKAGAERHGRDGETETVFLHIALSYGPRLGELFFHPASFRPDAPDGPELELGRYVGKGGIKRASRKDKSLHAVPLTDDDVALLAPYVEQARAARADTVWLEEDATGALKPISYDAMRGRLVRAAHRAGIDKARIVHGMRHHAGEQMERVGGLARVQQLLGHKQITTSRRYAHGNKATLRADLDQISRKKSRPSPAQVPPSKSM